jgi:hypothetical protein
MDWQSQGSTTREPLHSPAVRMVECSGGSRVPSLRSAAGAALDPPCALHVGATDGEWSEVARDAQEAV